MNILSLILVFFVSLFFTYKAAGSLSPTKINMPMATLYLFYLQQGIGSFLIAGNYLGHYLYKSLNNKSLYTNETLYVVSLVALLLPFSIYMFNKAFKLDVKKASYNYAAGEVVIASKDTFTFGLVVLAGSLALVLLVILFRKIKYIPLLKLFFAEKGFAFGEERIRINSINIIHPIIRNVVVLTGIPVLSYFSLAYALSSKKIKWWILFGIFFFASILTKTYNFEKSPIVFYLATLILVYIYFKGNIKFRRIILFAFLGAGIIFFMYFVTMGTKVPLNLYDGPFARAVFTPVGVIALNLDLFPHYLPFLSGRSLPSTLIWLTGFKSSESVRSARVLMEYYGSESVYEGTGGVFNTLFIGEAYANWGYWGMILSIIWVGLIIALAFNIILRTKKTPANIALNAYLTMSIATTSQGGFVDFLFNGNWFVVVLALVVMHLVILKEIKKEGILEKNKSEKLSFSVNREVSEEEQ
jgi:hypothetical protein